MTAAVQSQTELLTELACDRLTVTIVVSRLEAGFFYRWRQLRKQGRTRLLVEVEGETLAITPLDEAEVLGKKDGGTL